MTPDPNVLVSAFISGAGFPAAIHRAWLSGLIDFIVSPLLLKELEEVLLRPKFRRYGSEAQVREFVARIEQAATVRRDGPTERIVPADVDDDYLMALGKTENAEFVLSGDSHLTSLLDPSPPVITPRGLYELLVLRGLVPRRNR